MLAAVIEWPGAAMVREVPAPRAGRQALMWVAVAASGDPAQPKAVLDVAGR